MTILSNLHFTRQADTRCDVGVVPDYAIVIDEGAGIRDDIIPNYDARIQDGSRHDGNSHTQLDIGA